MSDKLMQCPKAKECPTPFKFKNTIHNRCVKHQKMEYCHLGWDGCPACIEVPEPRINNQWNKCFNEELVCPHQIDEKPCDCEWLPKSEPQGQLVILPDRTAIPLVDPTLPINLLIGSQIDAVYASAKKVDIDALAKYIWEYILKNGLLLSVDKDYLEQAITEYMELK